MSEFNFKAKLQAFAVSVGKEVGRSLVAYDTLTKQAEELVGYVMVEAQQLGELLVGAVREEVGEELWSEINTPKPEIELMETIKEKIAKGDYSVVGAEETLRKAA